LLRRELERRGAARRTDGERAGAAQPALAQRAHRHARPAAVGRHVRARRSEPFGPERARDHGAHGGIVQGLTIAPAPWGILAQRSGAAKVPVRGTIEVT